MTHDKVTGGVRFLLVDVFTDVPFAGNQLAVIPDGVGLSSAQMQAIAREFNFSETVFALPPENPAHTRRLRIFTPTNEIPFAGHPTVGGAYALAAAGDIPLHGAETRIVLEEGVGPVRVLIRARDGAPVFSQLSVAKLPVMTPAPDAAALAAVLSLDAADVRTDGPWTPTTGSCGLPFVLVPLRDRRAVARARYRTDVASALPAGALATGVMLFAMEGERAGSHVRARMFAPEFGVPEDPATGSACAALGGYLAARHQSASGTLHWVVEQGFEMGRPSIVDIEVDKAQGQITEVRVGGASVLVAEGTLSAHRH
jgi:trans-2,3-dihydro-3-hydroxyanthranilate isomerase